MVDGNVTQIAAISDGLSKYDAQATAFLTAHGLTFTAIYVGPDCPEFCGDAKHDGRKLLPCGGVHGGKYTVGFVRRNSAAVSFDFWNSYADEYGPGDDAYAKANKIVNRSCIMMADEWYKQPFDKRRMGIGIGVAGGRRVIAKPPTAYGVLSTISLDASVPDTFAEFCGEFGYDTDSRKAEALYTRCVAHALKLRTFFTTDELDALADIQ